MKTEKLSLNDLEKRSYAAYSNGNSSEAMHYGAQAIRLAPDNEALKMRYAYYIEAATINEFRPDIKIALASCLKSDRIYHQKMWRVWSSLLLKGPMYAFLFDQTISPQKYWKNIDSLLNDDFFLYGIRRFLIARPDIEQALKRLRHALLDAAPSDNMLRGKHLPLLSSLGIQCFFNEYVWSISAQENRLIAELDLSTPTRVAMLSCYKPLSQFPQASEWLATHGNGPLSSLMNVQIAEGLTEKNIIPSLKQLAPIAEKTSQAVQAMYEENPYPRWTCVDTPFNAIPDVTLDWLTAGCGTGRPLSQLALALPNVSFTAVDLSRSSLAYAMRKTGEANIHHIDFYHGDLTDIGMLGKNFDFIESSGVLHHMKDPVAGWKALLSCLRPGGRMQIGLYSTAARSAVFNVRDYIREKGYPATQDGIRQLRDDILALDHNHPLRAIVAHQDFYSLSECRDLVFHIQETTYTIPEIRKILDELDLSFLYFKLRRSEADLYRRHYPTDTAMTNLDNWHALEQKHPRLFAGMYKFFCCRKSEVESLSQKYDVLEKNSFMRGH